ncbi:DUF418 domain-containing protein [Halonotius sp. F2-221B]|uniref:DUF418 domain-containing protein n=1 Tax=Halonotius sp. F2-221B TaxID=2731620 RepID=UPI00398A7088
MSSTPSPTPPEDRILGLDVLRGFALLGILVINIWVFSMPFATLNNPTVYASATPYGEFAGANYLVWLLGHIFAQRKFITLFTIMFGAGIVLFTRSKPDSRAIRLHYRRTAFLLLVGLAHAYLLWYGDILVPYALCSLAVVAARDWKPTSLARIGLLLIVVPTLSYLAAGVSIDATQTLAVWTPSESALLQEVETYRSGWLAQFDHRAQTAFTQQTSGFLGATVWRTSGLMLWGMALFKWGVLSNERSTRFYRHLLAGGGGIGLLLIGTGVWYTEAVDWAAPEALFFGTQFNYWGSLFLAGAYIAGIMLFCRRFGGGRVTTALSAVGRTAFSNYLLQTLLATSIFYGHGLGLFGSVTRVEQAGIVVAIWAIQIVLSVVWLRYFRFGPMEWVWRAVTYGERPPLRNDGSADTPDD